MRKKGRKILLHETTADNDIRYRGPLSYQHFQAMGWLCIALYAACTLLKFGAKLDQTVAVKAGSILQVLEILGEMSLPLLLIANYAKILNTSEGYRKQLIKNSAAMVGYIIAFYLLFYRYILGILGTMTGNPVQAENLVLSFPGRIASYGFFAFNIFVDLFLCTLVMFFLNYRPSRIFRGKSVLLFRLLSLLPIGYEIWCMVLKVQSARGMIHIPPWFFPLLPVKPPMTFVLFIILALYVKTRERRFIRHGKSHEDFKVFLKTRRNSRNFSFFLAIMMIVVSLIDFLIVIGFSVTEGLHTAIPNFSQSVSSDTPASDVTEENRIAADSGDNSSGFTFFLRTSSNEMFNEMSDAELEAAFYNGSYIAFAAGFGNSLSLLFLAPVVLLFSYTRKPKWPVLDMIIPVAGIGLIVILFLEAFLFFVRHYFPAESFPQGLERIGFFFRSLKG